MPLTCPFSLGRMARIVGFELGLEPITTECRLIHVGRTLLALSLVVLAACSPPTDRQSPNGGVHISHAEAPRDGRVLLPITDVSRRSPDGRLLGVTVDVGCPAATALTVQAEGGEDEVILVATAVPSDLDPARCAAEHAIPPHRSSAVLLDEPVSTRTVSTRRGDGPWRPGEEPFRARVSLVAPDGFDDAVLPLGAQLVLRHLGRCYPLPRGTVLTADPFRPPVQLLTDLSAAFEVIVTSESFAWIGADAPACTTRPDGPMRVFDLPPASPGEPLGRLRIALAAHLLSAEGNGIAVSADGLTLEWHPEDRAGPVDQCSTGAAQCGVGGGGRGQTADEIES
jgi:hypothetical protein